LRFTREQRAGGVLEAGQVAGNGGHEAVGGLARGAHGVAIGVHVARVLDQLAQRDRGTAGLAAEPVPVPRQQRDFARDHAELGTADAARHLLPVIAMVSVIGTGGGRQLARHRRHGRAAQVARIDVVQRAVLVVEREVRARVVAAAQLVEHLGPVALRDALEAEEHGQGGGWVVW
jgi:hypothetical protein